jgi:16S rRNA (cytosine1402-N4)-methyltransferase
MPKEHQNVHIPVLLGQVLSLLGPQEGDSYLDLTAGYGGHAAAIFARGAHAGQSVLVDRDESAAHELRVQFGDAGAAIRHEDFLAASRKLLADGRQFDMVLADLGVSSPHLTQADRGFSITRAAPLDMRMDKRQELTAATIVNEWSEAAIADILKRYGEEPKARQIAQKIVAHRPIETTTDLARIVASAWPGKSNVHPATRTFQALRIAVNDELKQLEASLPLWIALLKPGGRVAAISFHSLEDRIVKQAFSERAGNRYDAELRLLTKRPVVPEQQEIVFNPRARSAKLRAAVKIKRKGSEHANPGKKQLPNV